MRHIMTRRHQSHITKNINSHRTRAPVLTAGPIRRFIESLHRQQLRSAQILKSKVAKGRASAIAFAIEPALDHITNGIQPIECR